MPNPYVFVRLASEIDEAWASGLIILAALARLSQTRRFRPFHLFF